MKGLQKEAASAQTFGTESVKRSAELRDKLGRMQAALTSSKAEQRESELERKSAEALENLKHLFPGVRRLRTCALLALSVHVILFGCGWTVCSERLQRFACRFKLFTDSVRAIRWKVACSTCANRRRRSITQR